MWRGRAERIAHVVQAVEGGDQVVAGPGERLRAGGLDGSPVALLGAHRGDDEQPRADPAVGPRSCSSATPACPPLRRSSTTSSSGRCAASPSARRPRPRTRAAAERPGWPGPGRAHQADRRGRASARPAPGPRTGQRAHGVRRERGQTPGRGPRRTAGGTASARRRGNGRPARGRPVDAVVATATSASVVLPIPASPASRTTVGRPRLAASQARGEREPARHRARRRSDRRPTARCRLRGPGRRPRCRERSRSPSGRCSRRIGEVCARVSRAGSTPSSSRSAVASAADTTANARAGLAQLLVGAQEQPVRSLVETVVRGGGARPGPPRCAGRSRAQRRLGPVVAGEAAQRRHLRAHGIDPTGVRFINQREERCRAGSAPVPRRPPAPAAPASSRRAACVEEPGGIGDVDVHRTEPVAPVIVRRRRRRRAGREAC